MSMSEAVSGPAGSTQPTKSLRAGESRARAGLARAWPPAEPAPRWVPAAAALPGLLAALLLPSMPRPGIGLLICGVAAAAPVGWLAFQRGRARGRRWPVGRIPLALGLIAVGLAGVCAVRASEWLALGCAAAALCLAAAAALDVRRWPGLLATVPLFGVAILRAMPWTGRVLPNRSSRWLSTAALKGLVIGTTCMLVVALLLASADAAFAEVLGWLWPSGGVQLFSARAAVFLATAGTVLGALLAVSTRLIEPKLSSAASVSAVRPAVEWLTPLILVALTIAAFLAVEATMLFGGADVVNRMSSVSHAERARQGFGQLAVVTLIVLVLLAWAGRAAGTSPGPQRRLMAAAGGSLLVLSLLLATSALRRLWLYQDAYGWTVTRLNAGVFETWVVAVLLGVATGWLLRRTDVLPRLVIGSAALGLLLTGMAGPDAIVAGHNVERFERGGGIDIGYLSALSADAVPALYRLPEPYRSCALAGREPAGDPWFGWNLSRARADDRLRSQPVSSMPVSC